MQKKKNITLPWWAVLCGIAASVLFFWLFDRFGKPDLARPVGLSVIALGFAVAFKWNLRRRVWFWIAMIAIAVFHIAIVLNVTWTSRWIPALVLTPLVFADFAIVVTIITLLERSLDKQRRSRAETTTLR